MRVGSTAVPTTESPTAVPTQGPRNHSDAGMGWRPVSSENMARAAPGEPAAKMRSENRFVSAITVQVDSALRS